MTKSEGQKISVAIGRESDIRDALDALAQIASEAGFGKLDIASIMNAASEIATNALKHAGGGEVTVHSIEKGIEIIVTDKGPGIPDVKKALTKGYTSVPGSLGLGLKATKRAMDEFSINSKIGQGTEVVMRKYLGIPYEEIEYGIATLAKPGEKENGDQYVIKEYEGEKILLAVIDGEGHGPDAHEAGVLVKSVIEEHYNLPLDKIVRLSNEALNNKPGRNAVVSLLRVISKESEYIGIGDTEIIVIPSDEHTLYSHPGQIGGRNFPQAVSVQSHSQPRKFIAILYSDGIKRRFSAGDLPLEAGAQAIADFIMKNYRRDTDDATVLVAKRKQ